MSKNRLGYIRMTFERLENMTHLPNGMKIINVSCGPFIHEGDAIHITVTHPSFAEVPDKEPTPRKSWGDIELCRSLQETT